MSLYQIQQSTTAYPLVFLMIDASDGVTGKTGLSPTVTLSKAGGSFGSPSGSVTEIADGWYKVAGNATDVGTLGSLTLHASASGANPTDAVYEVIAVNPQSSSYGLPFATSSALSTLQSTANTIVTDVISLGSPMQAGTAVALAASQPNAVTFAQGIVINQSQANADALVVNGNANGHGFHATSVNGSGIYSESANGNGATLSASNGQGMYITAGAYGIYSTGASGGALFLGNFGVEMVGSTQPGLYVQSVSTDAIVAYAGGTTGIGMHLFGSQTAGEGLRTVSASGPATTLPDLTASPVAGSIIDASFTVPTLTGPATGVVGYVTALFQKAFFKSIYDSNAGTLKTYASNSSTVVTTQTTSDSAGVQTLGKAS